MSMGILPDGTDRGRGGLGGTEGRTAEGEQSTEKRIGRAEAEHIGVVVVDRSMDWNTSFANHAWSILWAAVYQASRSVFAGRPKGMVAI